MQTMRCRSMIALTALLLRAAEGFACPACKDALAADPVGNALSATTLLLIGVPVFLVGSLGGWIAYVYWRAARRGLTPPGRSANFWRPVWTGKESQS